MRKAQTAVEFVILISFMILIFFVFFIIIQQKVVATIHEQDVRYLREANNIVLSEIQLAKLVHADYMRNFTITTIGDKPLFIRLADPYELVSSYADLSYVNFLSLPVHGQINVGDNVIYKLDGIMQLEDGSLRTNFSYAGVFLNVNPEECYLHTRTNTCHLLSYELACTEFFPALCYQVCGNSILEQGEICDPPTTCSAPYDGTCVFCNSVCENQTLTGPFCGDGTCNGPEDFGSCPADCSPLDGDVSGYITTIEIGGSGSGIYQSILQPNGTYGKDTYVDDYTSNLNANYGADTALHAGDWATWGGRRSYLYFDLSFLSFPEEILQANLSLYWHAYSWCNTVNAWCYNGRSFPSFYTNAPLYIQRVTQDWDEFTTTWNNQPTTTSLQQVSVPAPTSMIANHTDIDVTLLSQEIIVHSNYGFMIRVQDESAYRSVNFASSDNIYPSLHPRLVIEYTICGDGICAGNEDNVLCPADCP